MSLAIIIVAAGRGHRMNAETPKQYLPLGDSCALGLSVNVFLSMKSVQWVVPVIHPDDRSLCDKALDGFDDARLLPPADGGETRAASVRNGLECLRLHAPDEVLIHDAARPFVPVAVIEAVAEALRSSDGACAALPVVDALWTANGNKALNSMPRDGLWRAQTPQGFRFDKILDAHRRHDGNGADDVAVAREAGLEVQFVPGSEQSYKITTPADLERARRDLKSVL